MNVTDRANTLFAATLMKPSSLFSPRRRADHCSNESPKFDEKSESLRMIVMGYNVQLEMKTVIN